MEFSLNVVLDDDATQEDLANALVVAANRSATGLRSRHTLGLPMMKVDDGIDYNELRGAGGKIQDIQLNRHV
ncbi:hypothetical protein JXVLWARM_CDS_0089 [Burkholderia phage Bm1]